MDACDSEAALQARLQAMLPHSPLALLSGVHAFSQLSTPAAHAHAHAHVHVPQAPWGGAPACHVVLSWARSRTAVEAALDAGGEAEGEAGSAIGSGSGQQQRGHLFILDLPITSSPAAVTLGSAPAAWRQGGELRRPGAAQASAPAPQQQQQQQQGTAAPTAVRRSSLTTPQPGHPPVQQGGGAPRRRRWVRPPLCGPLVASLELSTRALALGAALPAVLVLYNASLAPIAPVLCCGLPPPAASAAAAAGGRPVGAGAGAAAAAAAGVVQFAGTLVRRLPALAPGHRLALPLSLLPLHVGQGDVASLLHVQLPGEAGWRRLIDGCMVVQVK